MTPHAGTAPELTDGTLLGGRVVYRQPATGFRTGIEPVLLAASVAARPGERVLEGGTGAGAAMLCLAARRPDVEVVGIEQDGALAELANANIRANGFALARAEAADVLAFQPGPVFDHAMANPPWHDPGSTPSPMPRRAAAKQATPELLYAWAGRLAGATRAGGTVTLLVPAASTAAAWAALTAAGCGRPALLPLWPRAGQEARLVLLRAIKARRGAARVLHGLALHEGSGFSPDARAILWEGAALEWR